MVMNIEGQGYSKTFPQLNDENSPVKERHPAEENPLLSEEKPNMAVPGVKETAWTRRMAVIFRENVLIFATLLAIVVGLSIGIGLRQVEMSSNALMWLGLPGEVFLRCLKATIVPLLVCMVITGASRLEPKSNGKIALVALACFFLSSVLAILTATVFFFIFSQDSGELSGTRDRDVPGDLETQDVFADVIRNLFPDNIISATFLKATTEYKQKSRLVTNATDNSTMEVFYFESSGTTADGVNILGLITICTVVGIAANKSLPGDSSFLTFFKHGQEVMFVIVRYLFWTTPFGVASLIAKAIASVDDLSAVFYSLGMFVASVIVALLVHQLISLPAVLFIFTRKNPYVFLARCLRPFFIAFSATATSVALPDMMSSCDQNQVDHSVSSFVIPMSVTLHADASGLFMISAALFLAKSSGLGIATSAYFSMGFLAVILSMTIPPVPSASIVNVVIILSSANYPLEDVALLFAVEWILDRCRSGVNAVSHVVCAAITAAICVTGSQEQGQGQNCALEISVVDVENDADKKDFPTEHQTNVGDADIRLKELTEEDLKIHSGVSKTTKM